FFETATRNLETAGTAAGVQRLVIVSIVGTDKTTAGYGAAVLAHERAAVTGPIPARIVRATQFHEFVGQLVKWGTQGDTAYVANMRMQPVAARSVAEVLADVATQPDFGDKIVEVAGPREEQLADVAERLVEQRKLNVKVQRVSDPSDPITELYESGAMLPSPGAILSGPTFADWLEASRAHADR